MFARHYNDMWTACPLSGCRAPELAAGKIDDVMSKVWRSFEASLLKRLVDGRLNEESRQLIVADFHAASVHISIILRLKLANWQAFTG